ncbi:MAG: hypothetical protein JWM80_5258 [Cyanobacteria bacterium RYN_339]|nr:hypothetical protein [Cyanobacteria bacterium RYN_339]
MRALPLALALLVAVPVPGQAACSAARQSPKLPAQPALPAGVAAMRAAIAKAAVRCDFAGLQALTERGDNPFTYKLGGDPGEPGTYWQHEEARGAHPLLAMVRLLKMPYVRLNGGLQYVWPSAYQDRPRPADWGPLGSLYSADAIAHFQQLGYLGYRLGIGQTGEWLYFVQGD